MQFTENIGTYVGDLVSKAAAPTVEIAGNVAKGIPNVLVNTVITILSSYLFIAEQDKILAWMRRYAPKFVLRYAEYLKKDAGESSGIFSGPVSDHVCSGRDSGGGLPVFKGEVTGCFWQF